LNRPEETSGERSGDWIADASRGIWRRIFCGLSGGDDDVITSSGYALEPARSQDWPADHPAVARWAVVGKAGLPAHGNC